MKKVCVLGAGSWGTALALVLARNNNDVILWTRDENQRDLINNQRKNDKYLKGIYMYENIKSTCDLNEAIEGSELVIIATPSQTIRDLSRKIKQYISKEQIIVSVSKGLEKGSGLRISEVIKQEIDYAKVSVLSGPSHAEEVALELPTTIVVASTSSDISLKVQDLFMNNSFRVYTNDDLIGVELGGTLKNIIAFGSGICDGIGYGDNTKAALITRGLAEIKRLGVMLGAKEETFSGLSGIGDLIVTCTSPHSRNKKAGMLIGQGENLENTLKEVKMVVEGITATDVVYNLSKELNIEMPITSAIYSILYENMSAKDAVNNLMSRDGKSELSIY